MVKPATRKYLHQLNHDFYLKIASEFDSTRQHPWEGWLQLLPYLWDTPQPFQIADIGCGNGRFGTFLEEFGFEDQYLGVDFSEGLLKEAKKRLPHAVFRQHDISQLTFFNSGESVDIICLFAVLHHIPGYDQRLALLKYCVQHLKKEGLLIFTAWQFLEIEALVKRIVPWEKLSGDIDLSEIEKDDYLLDWQRGQHAIRYCHLIDRQEISQLVEALQLMKVTQYYADGKNGKSNIYVVLQKQ